MDTKLLISIAVLSLGLSIWTMQKSKNIERPMKIAWIIVVFACPFIGAALYFLLRKGNIAKQRNFKPHQ